MKKPLRRDGHDKRQRPDVPSNGPFPPSAVRAVQIEPFLTAHKKSRQRWPAGRLKSFNSLG